MIAQLRFNNGYICNSGDDEVLSVECPRCGGFYLHHAGSLFTSVPRTPNKLG
jgi:hypothetical protein